MSAQVRPFGTTADGQQVQAVTLRCGDATAVLLTWGAVLQDLRLAGVPYGLTHGSDALADYENALRYHGSLIGPVVNRITGAAAVIAGKQYQFSHSMYGAMTLHCGDDGTHVKVWDLVSADASSVTLAIDLPDGMGGFPGNRHIEARFTLEAPARLRMEVTGTTDAATLMNFANHSYWNLDGTPCWDGHSLRIAAEHYLPATEVFTPTGEIAPVAGTDHDLRKARVISVNHPPMDHCYVLGTERVPLRDVLWLRGVSGLEMIIATTEPGIQAYDGRHAIRPGHAAYEGLAFEPEFWPDATNNPGFPKIDLAPGETYRQVTEWRFTRS
ncbi:MAG: aldose epimerase family protein [Paracoccaceae bacterium]